MALKSVAAQPHVQASFTPRCHSQLYVAGCTALQVVCELQTFAEEEQAGRRKAETKVRCSAGLLHSVGVVPAVLAEPRRFWHPSPCVHVPGTLTACSGMYTAWSLL
jgi:hypothetical protein